MGALAFTVIGLQESQHAQNEVSEFDLIAFLFNNYIYMCLGMVAVGVLYLMGGLNVRKHRLWANKLVTYLSFFLIVLIWTLVIALSKKVVGYNNMEMFRLGATLTALFWSIPIGLLIWFLNKQKIKQHFV